MRKILYAGLSILSLVGSATCTLETHPTATGAALGGAGCSDPGACDGGSDAMSSSGKGAAGTAAVGGRVSVGTGGSAGMLVSGSGGTPALDAGMAPDAIVSMPDAQVDAAPPLLANGSICSNDDACVSSHCDGICCAGGDCCKTPADCNITTGGVTLACNDVTQCQGSGGRIECSDFRCQAVGGAPDDSACTSMTVANNCGAFKPVFCSGGSDQQAPSCPTRCSGDGDCDSNAHCIATGTCVPDLTSGGLCVRNEDCASGHCNNSLCCDRDDCCAQPSDCPGSYSNAATCDMAATCQGSRKAAVCNRNICGSQMLQDDSACNNNVAVNDCGLFADVRCNGNQNQAMPMCQRTCMVSAQCDSNAYCDNGSCVAKKPDGEMCGALNESCISGTCASNGLCCDDGNGQCCKMDAQCSSALFTIRRCDNLATCSGSIQRPVCNPGGRCASGTATPDNTVCDNMQHNCGTGFASSSSCPAQCDCRSAASPCATGFMCSGDGRQCMMVPIPPVAGMGGDSGSAAPIDISIDISL